MAPIDILFFTVPIPREVPGFLPSYPSAFFPCLGAFHFIDCGIANTMFAGVENRLFFIRKEHAKHFGVYAQTDNVPFTPVFMEKEREKSLLDYLAGKKKGKVILYNLSAACLVESRQLMDTAENCGEGLIRISVDYLPSDIYIASADYLLRIINAHPQFMETLFSELLPAYSDQMEEIEGKVIFFSNIANFMNVHLELINWKNNEKGCRRNRNSCRNPVDCCCIRQGL